MVYDASVALKPKNEMKKLPVGKLQKGDLVLIQTRIKKRFEKNKPGEGEQPKAFGAVKEFTINFQLNAVCFLQENLNPPDNDVGAGYSI
jgi:hypothetical protein